MKLTLVFNRLAKVAILLFVAMVMPLYVSAQSNNKKNNPPPPPPPKASAPAASQRSTQPQRPPAHQGGAKPAPQGGAKPALQSGVKPAPQGGAKPALQSGVKPAPQGGAKPALQGGVKPAPQSGVRSAPQVGLRSVPQNLKPVRGGNGNSTYKDEATGRRWETNNKGEVTHYSEPGREVKFGGNGRPTYIRDERRGMTIDHGPHGERHIVTERRDANGHFQSRVVGMGSHRGYVEHPFQRGGHEYMRRTYVVGGRSYVNVYRGYHYHGVVYYRYVPAYYYHPMFYGWAYNPWPGPVYYAWGWNAAPWYAPYGYYFAPYPVYPSAAFWLTDYVISENLRAAYEAGAASAAGAGGAGDVQAPSAGQPAQSNSVTLTPEVKQMIAEEVKAQLAAEQAAATQGSTSGTPPTSAPQQPAADTDQVPPALDPSLRVFIVATNLDVTANGQACSLSAGDVLMRTEDSPDKDNSVGVSVVSSKKPDCSMGSSPRVQVADLQEMHNHFREQLDSGVKTLADNQGKNGLPSGPAASPRQNPDGQSAADLTATADLQKQQQDAEQAEKEVQQASLGDGNGR
jgi:hypothetical protein